MKALLLALLLAATAHANPSGYGLLQGGSRNNSLTNAQIAHPKISFIVLRDRWNAVEKRPGVYDFTYLASQVRRCRAAGKGYFVAVMTGGGSTPDFVPGPRYKGCIVPWAPAIPEHYSRLMAALADFDVDSVKLSKDVNNVGVWCTGPTVPSQELHLNGMERARGFSPTGIVSNWKQCIAATKASFSDKPGILSVSGQAAVLKYQPQIIAAMETTYGKAACWQHNSLGTQTNVNAAHHQVVLGQKRKGYCVGAEMVQPGNTAGLVKFPEREYAILYPGDEKSIK